MSNFLAVDTSSRYLTVLAVKDGLTILRHLPECAMRHSVILMDEIDSALNEAGLAPDDCDFFSAVTGPGSFTGIRIGIAAVKGFATATNKPLLGVTAFELIAYNVNSADFYVVIDAAHGHCYVCGFGGDKKVTLPPSYLSFGEVEKLHAPLYGFEALPFENYTSLAVKDCLLNAVLAKEGSLTDGITALYVRKSQAEEARGGS